VASRDASQTIPRSQQREIPRGRGITQLFYTASEAWVIEKLSFKHAFEVGDLSALS
jgi:hypothetical protein